MTHLELVKLIEIWKKHIVGTDKSFQVGTDVCDYLYSSLVSRNKEVCEALKIDQSLYSEVSEKILLKITNDFSKIEPHQLGFFPIGILLTNKLTCAGSTMLINTILRNNHYNVYYLRPAFHSVNLVKMGDVFYWIDGANGVLDKINIEIENRDNFDIAHIRSNNPKIPYRLAPKFKPRELIINIFGNMQVLKNKPESDPITEEYLKKNREVYNIDFNYYKDALYKDYFDYVRSDSKFREEQERIRKWING